MENEEEDKDKFWADGSFVQTMSQAEAEKKMRTFHMKNNEEMNFSCKKCNKKISAHNNDWHDGMCDDCFNKKYFPEDQAAYERRLIDIDGRKIDPICMTTGEFEQGLMLETFIETTDKKDKKYIDAFFMFLNKMTINRLFTFMLYDGEITDMLDMSMEEIKNNLALEHDSKGLFYSDDICISKMFTDGSTFYIIPEENIIFFAGKEAAAQAMKTALNELEINFSEKKLIK